MAMERPIQAGGEAAGVAGFGGEARLKAPGGKGFTLSRETLKTEQNKFKLHGNLFLDEILTLQPGNGGRVAKTVELLELHMRPGALLETLLLGPPETACALQLLRRSGQSSSAACSAAPSLSALRPGTNGDPGRAPATFSIRSDSSAERRHNTKSGQGMQRTAAGFKGFRFESSISYPAMILYGFSLGAADV